MGDLHSVAFSPLPFTPTHDSCKQGREILRNGNIPHVLVCMACANSWVILGLPCHYLSSQQLFISLSLWYNASLPPAYLWHPCAASVYRSSRLPLILNVFVALSLFLSPTRSPSPFLIPLLYLFHLLFPRWWITFPSRWTRLNPREAGRVALISPTSHSRETRNNKLRSRLCTNARMHVFQSVSNTRECVFLPGAGEYERSQISLGPVCDLHVVCKWMRHYMTIPFLSMHRYTEEKVHVLVHMCRICAFST